MNNCSPKCVYFPNPEIVNWKWSADKTYKIPVYPIDFICGYDKHIIKNWTDPCPRIVNYHTP